MREFHPALEASLDIGAFQVTDDFSPLPQPFASGKQANNKFLGDLAIRDDQPPEVQNAVIEPMSQLVLESEFRPSVGRRTALYGMPNGGQLHAQKQAERLGLPFARLKKVINLPGQKTYGPDTEEDLEILEEADDLLGFEDTGTEWTSLHGAINGSHENGLGMLEFKTRGVFIYMQRGLLHRTKKLSVPVKPLIVEPIPNMILPTDPFLLRVNWNRVVWTNPEQQ